MELNVVIREWGYYQVLYDANGTKVKELTVKPGGSLSMQRHEFRSEYWHVVEGCAVVNTMMKSGYKMPSQTLHKHQYIDILRGDWHQLTNPFDIPCIIIEIQYGEKCVEEDIERK